MCRRLLEQVISCGGLLPGVRAPEQQTVTWFQFHSYLQRQSVADLEKHFAQLTKEGGLGAAGASRQRGTTEPCPSLGPLSRFSEPPAVLLTAQI